MSQIRVPVVTPGTRPELAELEDRIKKQRGGQYLLALPGTAQ